MLADALCMGMLAVSTDKLDGTATAEGIDTAVLVIQQVSLFGENDNKCGDSAKLCHSWSSLHSFIKPPDSRICLSG